ncbi:hypothetical protein TRAPUB_14172 [Trametes pubescens]|uniref:Uncharacterized protein n=1 Tax=Trametes pubescens TaxID=154538 RepID=A0A1M2VP62_TRAPU|nr:hypothetical protein TRAPUB_14172 [Trametes pubescens]
MYRLSAQLISLEKDSLYIYTCPVDGGYHWAFVHIDEHGNATRHHWAAANWRQPHGPERYHANTLRDGAKDSTAGRRIVGYFKILDYTPMSAAAFQQVCASVFPGRNHTFALQNRQDGISCRTWCIAVLTVILHSQERAMQIERYVMAMSANYGSALNQALLSSAPYQTQIVAVSRTA